MQIDGADVPDGVELYDFEDFDTHRNLIYDNVKDTFIKQFPKEHNGVRMEVSDVDYADPPTHSIADQKKALQRDEYLARRLRGTVRLTDVATGKVLDEKKMTLMRVPELTNRGTFIREGNEWGTISQQRLIPGAYTRVQKNGDIATQINTRTGTGGAMTVLFNPESMQFKVKAGGGEVHLYSLLKDMGYSDDDLKEKWGESVWQANADEYDSRAFEKAYNKLVPSWDRDKNPSRSHKEKVNIIKNSLNRAQVATAAVKATLPNLFDGAKAASWKFGIEVMEKTASMSMADLQDVAAYINEVAGKDIDIDAPKKELRDSIINTISTGFKDKNSSTGIYDTEDPGVMVVRQLRMRRVMDKINKKFGKGR